MSDFDSLLASYDAGMRRDDARDALPKNSLWNSQDYIPDRLTARLRKRGGFAYASPAISSVTASASYIDAGIFAPFSAADKIIVFDEDGIAYNVGSTASATAITGAGTTRNPVFYDNTVIVPNSDGSTAPKTISSALAATALGGTPPAGKYAVIYKDVLWLAAPSATSDRIHFSVAGNPGGTWDKVNKYLDVSFPISGLAALQNAVFVFGLGRAARVRGSVPPPDSDFILDDPIFDVGCTDNRSITHYRDKVIWGNAEGLYISDGTAMDDLTRICGMKRWWQQIMAGEEGYTTSVYSISGSRIVTDVYGDYLFYSVTSGTSIVDCGMVDLTRFTWHRTKNWDAAFMFKRPYPSELFMCHRGSTRLSSMSGVFSPSSANKNDANGTAVLPVIETAYFIGAPTLKTFRRVALLHDIRDAASDNPYLTISYIDSPEETSYTALSPTLTETTEITKAVRILNKPSRGMAFKIEQTNASSDTRLYDLLIQAEEREGLR